MPLTILYPYLECMPQCWLLVVMIQTQVLEAKFRYMNTMKQAGLCLLIKGYPFLVDVNILLITRGFVKSQALGRLAGWEDDIDHLVWQCRWKVYLWRSSVQRFYPPVKIIQNPSPPAEDTNLKWNPWNTVTYTLIFWQNWKMLVFTPTESGKD